MTGNHHFFVLHAPRSDTPLQANALAFEGER